jgi:uncharacterized protein involved in tolerance to divalent cations
LGGGLSQAQDNLESLIEMVEANKAYALYKAKPGDKDVLREKEPHYIKIVSPVFKMVHDTIIISPALNGNLDTSNYFIQTEVITIKEPVISWKVAKVSPLCRKDEGIPHLTLSLVKSTPDYRIVHSKFYPFRNILDTTSTDYIIPSEKMIVHRKVCVQKTCIYYVTKGHIENLKEGEEVIKIPAGKWRKWSELTCPFGQYEIPSITDIQKELKSQAYEIVVTGKLDEQTKKAITAFQHDNLLETNNPLSQETMQRLGIKRERLISVDKD